MNSGVSRAASGRLDTTALPPEAFNGGVPTMGGKMSVDGSASGNYTNGMQYTPAGNICISLTALIRGSTRGGIPIGANGRVCCSVGQPVVRYLRAIPLDAAGRVALENSPVLSETNDGEAGQ